LQEVNADLEVGDERIVAGACRCGAAIVVVATAGPAEFEVVDSRTARELVDFTFATIATFSAAGEGVVARSHRICPVYLRKNQQKNQEA